MSAPDDDVTWGGTPLTAMRQSEVRERILVSDTGAALFAGRLGDRLDERGGGDVGRAVHAASAASRLSNASRYTSVFAWSAGVKNATISSPCRSNSAVVCSRNRASRAGRAPGGVW